MAEKSDNPFTNVRLMVTGIIFGVIAAALAYYYINKKVVEATGNPVAVCYLKKNLLVSETLTRDHVKAVEVPGQYAKAATRLVKYGELHRFVDSPPFRNMFEGEPLSVFDFPESRAEARQVKLEPGTVIRSLQIDSKTQPGKALHLGDLVSLTGNIRFSDARAGTKADIETLTILDKVRVRTINGSDEARQVENVKMIGVVVGERTQRRLQQLLGDRLVGGLGVSIHSSGETASAAEGEIPKATLDMMTDKGLTPAM